MRFGHRKALSVVGVVAVLLLSVVAVTTAASAASAAHPPASPAAPTPTAPSAATSPAPTVAPAPTGSGPMTLSEIRQDLAGRGVPAWALHLPALSEEKDRAGQPVAPLYTSAPAPMGVADVGLRDVGGSMTGYELNTSSAEGTLVLNTAQSVYVDGDGPDMFGVQLNSVLTNVTLFGNSTYQFWTQNFVSYTSSSGELSFGDNIWNFSDLQGAISQNVFYAHSSNGTLFAPTFYYAIGPTFTVSYPFTVKFYLNATTLLDRPAVFFNYSLISTTVTTSGSFDYVIFNSSATTPTSPAPAAMFQINGLEYDPIGLINDIELSVLGNDNGDTTTFYGLSGTATIAYWNATAGRYVSVPSALNYGTDTGETSDGVASYYLSSAPTTAQLGLGPSFLEGLWNTTTAPGVRTVTTSVTPTSALVLVNPGTARAASTAQWVPTVVTSHTTFYLPNTGSYFLDYLLSNYDPVSHVIGPGGQNGTTHITGALTADASTGIYTPMIAWGNAELATFASSGAGTAGSPYVLVNTQVQPLYPEFAQFNDFLFPVFPGLLLIQTTDYVVVSPAPYLINYPAWVLSQTQGFGLPSSNNLQDEFWLVSHVVVENAPIQGWLSAFLESFYPLGDVIFWNSTDNLIAGNTFNDQGSAVALYGGTGNTVWGNTFYTGGTSALDPAEVYNGPSNQSGVWVSESGDLIYNNLFSVPTPAYTPTYDPLSCQINCTVASYTDLWNVTRESATASQTVLGVVLTGSIIGTSYQGGSYWSNYGTPSNPYGLLPYANGPAGSLPPGNGWISSGGDYVPLVPFSLYNVTFNETGLPTGTAWGVNSSLADASSATTNLTIESPNGTVAFSVAYPACVTTGTSPPSCSPYALSAPANFTVSGADIFVDLSFAQLTNVIFAESGLAAGHLWNVTLNGSAFGGTNETLAASTGSIGWNLSAGLYNFSVASDGYSASPANGSFTVQAGTAGSVSVAFSLAATLVFNESGLPAGVGWTVSLTQGGSTTNVSSSVPTLDFYVFNSVDGAYSFTVTAVGYLASPAAGAGTLPADPAQAIVFTAAPGVLHLRLAPVCAEVDLNGNSVGPVCSGMNFSLAPGTYPVEITASGYLPYFNNVTIVAGGSLSLDVTLVAQPSAASSTSGVGTLGWLLVAVLAALALIFLITTLVLLSRRRPPPARPLTPASTGPAAPAPEAAPQAEWSETPAPNPPEGGST